MNRSELIAKVKELNIDLDRPAHMCTTEKLQEAFSKFGLVVIKAAPTMKARIIELGKEGKSYKEIQDIMNGEYEQEVRYGYILLVLKKEGIKVPRSKRKVLA